MSPAAAWGKRHPAHLGHMPGAKLACLVINPGLFVTSCVPMSLLHIQPYRGSSVWGWENGRKRWIVYQSHPDPSGSQLPLTRKTWVSAGWQAPTSYGRQPHGRQGLVSLEPPSVGDSRQLSDGQSRGRGKVHLRFPAFLVPPPPRECHCSHSLPLPWGLQVSLGQTMYKEACLSSPTA